MAAWDKIEIGNSTPTVLAPPTISLSAESDTDVKGDQRTSVKNVKLLAGSSQSNLLTWLSLDGNKTFDPAKDIPTIGSVVNVSLVAGVNTFTFYSLDLSSGITSLPTYYPVYLEPTAAFQQASKLDETLNKVALAYLGRPVTDGEYSVFRSTLETANGDPQALIQSLAGNIETHAIYTVPTLLAGLDRVYNTLFGRAITASEEAYWNNQVASYGVPILELPYRIAESAGLIPESASAADRGVLSARILFMQQANEKFANNLALAGVSERTFLEVERSAVQGVNTIADISKSYENLVSNAKNLLTSVGALPAPTVALDVNSDTGTKGDFETSLSSVKINVTGTTPGALAWLDSNFNGSFEPSADSVVVNGAVYANLSQGPNTLTFYQTLNGVVSQPSYLSLRRADPNTPTDPPPAPTLDLRADDDDGLNNTDNVTTKSLVRIDVSNLDPNANFAWLERDGNGTYNAGKDIALQTGAATASATVQLTGGNLGDNVIGFSAYQTRAGLRSTEGALSVTYLKRVDTITSEGGSWVIGPSGGTVSLKFDRPPDWMRLDINGDGKLTLGTPGDSDIELGISIGGEKDIAITNGPSEWFADVPAYGVVFLTVFGVKGVVTDGGNPVIGAQIVGVPDLSSGLTSDVYWSI